ncbi:MAG: hypothetical protein GW946_03025 [Candidatus Pacebacteria bacterium]|nr:hypothetical protein [Candidatus Paceibacterota bacterium]PIR60339.1 MAG: hypothetical protein COU67_02600 [Candidatus Pacebacteria bacterium CG10_big_fil_rev_8_21_14_0_10_44_54]
MKEKKQNFNLQLFLHIRQRLVIAIGVCLGTLLVVFLFGVPQLQQAFETRAKLQKESARLDKLKQKLSELDSVSYEPAFGQVEFISETLPSKKPLLELLTSLYAVTQKSGVIVDDFSVRPGLVATTAAELSKVTKNKNAGYDTIDLTLTITGSFDQIQDFILLTETVTPFTTISSFSLNATFGESTSQKERNVFTADLATSTFFFTQPISVSLEQPLPKLAEQDYIVLSELSEYERINLPEQSTVFGGGSIDFFQVEGFKFPSN